MPNCKQKGTEEDTNLKEHFLDAKYQEIEK